MVYFVFFQNFFFFKRILCRLTEVLKRFKFSEKSDVWAFGIVLFELFSYGEQPYFDKTVPETLEAILGGYTMTPSSKYPENHSKVDERMF